MKVACTVWSGGKGSDYFKALPITIDIVKYVGEDYLGVAPAGTTATVTFEHGGFWVFAMSLVNFNDGGLEIVGHIAEEANNDNRT